MIQFDKDFPCIILDNKAVHFFIQKSSLLQSVRIQSIQVYGYRAMYFKRTTDSQCGPLIICKTAWMNDARQRYSNFILSLSCSIVVNQVLLSLPRLRACEMLTFKNFYIRNKHYIAIYTIFQILFVKITSGDFLSFSLLLKHGVKNKQF